MFQKLTEVLSAYWPFLLAEAVAAYLLGSLSTAILVSRAIDHRDIRDVGSGNAGMTNVLRSYGGPAAVLTTLGDVGKSVIAVLLGGFTLRFAGSFDAVSATVLDDTAREIVGRYLAGLFCMLGHLFPVFFGFRGGKGVLVAFGMLLVMDWRVAILVLAVFGAVLAASRMVSLGSLCGSACAIPLTWVFDRFQRGYSSNMTWFCTVVTALYVLLIFVMHHGNIGRIIHGNERRLSFGKRKEG